MSTLNPVQFEAPPIGLAKAADVAKFLDTTTNQMARLRFEGRGPVYVKLGRSVRYRWADVYGWVESNLQATTDGAQ